MPSTETAASTPVADQISQLTDAAFDRVQAHIDRYAADERRLSEDGSLTLKSHQSFLHGPDRKYGRLVLKICDRTAESEVVSAMLRSTTMNNPFVDPNSLRTKGSLTHLKDWDHHGYMATFEIARDHYPQGNPAYRYWREPGGEDEPEQIPWGERHKVGFALLSLYHHKSLPLYEQHTQSVSLATRFDKEYPIVKTDHKARVIVADEIGGPGQQYFLDSGKPQLSGIPIGTALREVRGFLEAAKDLRPVVAGIASELEYDEFLTAATSQGTRSGVLPIQPTSL